MGSLSKLISYGIFLLGGLVSLRGFFDHKSKPIIPIESDPKNIDSFRMGSGIYIGTFLLGSNCDYRLVFLLFTIPHIIYFMKYFSGYVSRISKMLVFAIVISTWHLFWSQFFSLFPFGRESAYVLEECMNWLIFFGLIYLVSYSAPDWIKSTITTWVHRITNWGSMKLPVST
ncbi:MAG: hypothetical protein FJY97_09100 [candidate division Zixibacteria bacterium]|nr:hypothetical protein [candidate division Zixibacteria bacterium]